MYYPELPKDSDDAVLEFIDTTKEEGIPVDGFQLSSGYCAVETEQGIKQFARLHGITPDSRILRRGLRR